MIVRLAVCLLLAAGMSLIGGSANAQYGEIARQQAQFQARSQALQNSLSSRSNIYRSNGLSVFGSSAARGTVYSSGFSGTTIYRGGVYGGGIYGGPVYYGGRGYRGYGPGYRAGRPIYGAPYYPYRAGRPVVRPRTRSPTTGSHYFGNPHASQYFPR